MGLIIPNVSFTFHECKCKNRELQFNTTADPIAMQKFTLTLITLLFLFTLNRADAQRNTTYESLLQRSEQPSTYIDQAVLPVSDSLSVAAVFFRLEYDFLPFLRVRPNMQIPSPETEYYSPVRMGIEIFEGEASDSRRNSKRSGISVFRDFWSDTVWVSSFEETTSRFDHLQGVMDHELKNGSYHYELQLARGGSNKDLPSRSRNLNIPVQSESTSGHFILASETNSDDEHLSGTFLNYGNSVLYGQDFDLIVQLPVKSDSDSDSTGFTLQIMKLLPGSSTDTRPDPVFEKKISSENIFHAVFESAGSGEQGDIAFSLRKTSLENGFPFSVISIPNSGFENAGYKLELLADAADKPVAERAVNSQWIDMPVSLYNLDVAIDNMKFIVDENRLRTLKSGSKAEQEQKFREFWEQRDPTPETEFNELMTEYYRRIDFAYRNFSSMQTPGYETDQGRAYILYGPPENIERRLPANSPTREIWTYTDRTLIFEATTGFGDFKLVSES